MTLISQTVIFFEIVDEHTYTVSSRDSDLHPVVGTPSTTLTLDPDSARFPDTPDDHWQGARFQTILTTAPPSWRNTAAKENVLQNKRKGRMISFFKNVFLSMFSGIISAFVDSASQPFMKFLPLTNVEKVEATLNYKGKL